MRIVTFLVFAFALLAAGANAASPMGVSGTVMRSPIKPVCEEGIPCSAPAAGVVLVFVRKGVETTRTTTLRNGSFRVVLPPGTYVVRALRTFSFRGLRPRTAEVRPGRFTVIRLSIDTGIR